jgi:hypothetical protein
VVQRQVSLGELLDDLRSGRPFRVTRRSSGANCTVEVLAEVLYSAISDAPVGGDHPAPPTPGFRFMDALYPFHQR